MKLFDVEAEQVVLGLFLLDNKYVFSTSLKPEDFYYSLYRDLFTVILDIILKQNAPLDALTLYTECQKRNMQVSFSDLVNLSLYAPAVNKEHFEYYEKIIKEKSYKRKLYKKVVEIQKKLENEENVEEIINELFQFPEEYQQIDKNSLKKNITKLWDKITMGNKIETIKLGMDSIDDDIGGLQKGTLNIIACRPSIGKTSFALQIALNMAKNNYKILFFSLEMSTENLLRRLISQYSKIPLQRLNYGDLSLEDLNKVNETFAFISNSNLDILDISSLSIEDVERISNMYKSKFGLDAIFVDYLTLMKLPQKEKKVDAIGEITRRLKLLSKKLDIVVVLLSQLNRNAEDRVEKRPILADLRDSGNLEQDADMVFLIWRKPQENGLPSSVGEIILCKNRDGKTDSYNIHFDSNYLTFVDE